MQAVILLARVLMSAGFLWGGYRMLMAPTATMGMFTHYRLPMVGAVYALAVVVELGGGALTLLGWKTRYVAPAMAAWCAATAWVAHWHPGDSAQIMDFYQNLTMAGGFLLLAAYGAGRISLDRE